MVLRGLDCEVSCAAGKEDIVCPSLSCRSALVIHVSNLSILISLTASLLITNKTTILSLELMVKLGPKKDKIIPSEPCRAYP